MGIMHIPGHTRQAPREVALEEIRAIMEQAHSTAERILRGHTEQVERVVKALIERERLDGDEFQRLLDGKELGEIKKSDPFLQDEPLKPQQPEMPAPGAEGKGPGGEL